MHTFYTLDMSNAYTWCGLCIWDNNSPMTVIWRNSHWVPSGKKYSFLCHARLMQCQIYAALWPGGWLSQLEEYLIPLSIQLLGFEQMSHFSMVVCGLLCYGHATTRSTSLVWMQQSLSVTPFLPFLPILRYGGPFYFTCLALSDCLWFPFSTAQQSLPFPLGHYELSFGWRRPETIISLTTWLAVNPN